jgi:hypothetical protein
MAPPVKEYKEFFLRAVQTAGSGKPDKEANYPTEYIITTPNGNKVVNNRFLKTHFPSEDVFKKFLESITFKLNPEDTATTEIQGLVRIAVGKAIIDRLSEDVTVENGNNHLYTTVVIPSTLPIVSAGTGITITPQIRRVVDNTIVGSITPGDRGLYYLDYLVTNTGVSIDNVKAPYVVEVDTLTIDEGNIIPNGGGSNIIFTTIPANTLKTEGDHIDLDLTIYKEAEGVGTNPKPLLFYIGASLGDVFGEMCDIHVDTAIGEAKFHIYQQVKIFRITNTTGYAIGTIRYFAPINNQKAIGGTPYDKATKFFKIPLTDVDWDNFATSLALYYGEAPLDVNEAVRLRITQISKVIVNI